MGKVAEAEASLELQQAMGVAIADGVLVTSDIGSLETLCTHLPASINVKASVTDALQ